MYIIGFGVHGLVDVGRLSLVQGGGPVVLRELAGRPELELARHRCPGLLRGEVGLALRLGLLGAPARLARRRGHVGGLRAVVPVMVDKFAWGRIGVSRRSQAPRLDDRHGWSRGRASPRGDLKGQLRLTFSSGYYGLSACALHKTDYNQGADHDDEFLAVLVVMG